MTVRMQYMEIDEFGVLGCGLMGSGIAHVCATARSGHTQIVTLSLQNKHVATSGVKSTVEGDEF
jgi:3-hydroxyacyl-CoA dehydrogenase